MWQGNLIRAPGFCPSQPKSCPRLFRLMLLQHISSGQADVSWSPPCSALFDLSDQIIHFQLAQGWDTVAQLFHIHVSGSTGLLRDSLCCLFLFSLLRSFFIHQNKTKQNPPPQKKNNNAHTFLSAALLIPWCFWQLTQELGAGCDVNLGAQKLTWCSGEFHIHCKEGKLIGSFS